ncbi:MAG: flagellar basal-body rod protein FlgF [Candidatus Omnitrophica bacterium]|nr:flagellar basal-body rod protein FlgF [Candidatus Omnitrophota bacterium]
MIRGIYTAASGMSTHLKNQEIISNNLANADTAGFKRDQLVITSFREFLINRINDPKDQGHAPLIGSYSLGTEPLGTYTDHSEGGIISTERKFDVAIQGDGFFVIDTPQGEQYTRAGSFYLSNEQTLVTSEGYPVLGENGLVTITDENFIIGPEGEVVVDGTIVNRLLIVDLPPQAMIKSGDSLWRVEGEGGAAPATGYKIVQGHLESSNVNVVKEMVDMIAGMRTYEANQKTLVMQDETLGRLISELAR